MQRTDSVLSRSARLRAERKTEKSRAESIRLGKADKTDGAVIGSEKADPDMLKTKTGRKAEKALYQAGPRRKPARRRGPQAPPVTGQVCTPWGTVWGLRIYRKMILRKGKISRNLQKCLLETGKYVS